MSRSAIGLVETYGYIGAVEALDVSLKSANVKLVGCEFVKGGIVTIKITGDVAAVKASVEAAEAAVLKLNCLRSIHVIPRVSEEVWKMLQTDFVIKGSKKTSQVKCVEENNIKKIEEIEEIKQEPKEEPKEELKQELKQEDIVKSEKIDNNNKNDIPSEKIKEKEQTKENIEEVKKKHTLKELKAMKVQELRSLARIIQITSMTKKQIKFGKKEELIKAILAKESKEE